MLKFGTRATANLPSVCFGQRFISGTEYFLLSVQGLSGRLSFARNAFYRNFNSSDRKRSNVNETNRLVKLVGASSDKYIGIRRTLRNRLYSLVDSKVTRRSNRSAVNSVDKNLPNVSLVRNVRSALERNNGGTTFRFGRTKLTENTAGLFQPAKILFRRPF